MNSDRLKIFGYVFIFFLLIGLLIPLPKVSMLVDSLENASHAVLFGLLAILLVFTNRNSSPRGRLLTYAAALLIVSSFGVTIEFLQKLTHRDFDVIDAIRDAGGAFAGLILCARYDGQLQPIPAVRRRMFRFGAPFITLTIAALLLWPTVRNCAAYAFRNSLNSVLCDFSLPLQGQFIHLKNARLSTIISNGRCSGRLIFSPSNISGLAIGEPFPDWSRYDTLVLQLFNPRKETCRLSLRIHDIHHNQQYADRFSVQLIVPPGPQRIAVAALDIRKGPKTRLLDMKHIAGLMLFKVPAQFDTIDIERIYFIEHNHPGP
jgi:VanZ family protein